MHRPELVHFGELCRQVQMLVPRVNMRYYGCLFFNLAGFIQFVYRLFLTYETQQFLPGINMQCIVWIPSFKQAECIQYVHQNTTLSKANIPV